MFRKLKIELVLTNLLLTGLVLITIFSGIYILMKRSFDNSSYLRMYKTAQMERIPPSDHGPRENKLSSGDDFFIKTDKDGKINEISLNSILSFKESRSIVKNILDNRKERGTISYSGGELRYTRMHKKYGFIIVLLDKSFDNEVLKRLVIISAIICIISLVLVLIISLFLADMSLRPIISAWKKQKAFVADASHELRTPLAVITTNLDIVLDNGDESVSSQVRWLKNIKLESERMTRLIENLLFLARTDSNKNCTLFVEFNLSTSIVKSIIPFEAVCIKNNINLVSDVEPDIIFVGNEERIKQLVAILIDNSVKHTPAGGSIKVIVHKIKNIIEIIVSDTGEGIPKEHIDKIFDRFYKIDKSRVGREGNFGLGLSIAKTIVKEHRGNISVSSIVGKGSTFKVTFN